jgi:hypothetical protein
MTETTAEISIPKPNVGIVLQMFLDRIDSLLETFSTIYPIVVERNNLTVDEAAKYLNQNLIPLEVPLEGEEIKFTFDPTKWHEIIERIRTISKAGITKHVLPRIFVVSLISEYDAFLSRLVLALFEGQPGLLNSIKREIPFNELIGFTSITEAKEYVLEKEIETLLRGSHTEQFDWLESKFSIKLREGLAIWPAFIEITERRNLFVHTSGRVSSQYLAVCQKHGVKFEKLPKDRRRIAFFSEVFRKRL